MADNKCPQCGAPIDPDAMECRYCGERLVVQRTLQQERQAQPQPQVVYVQQPQAAPQQPSSGIDPSWPIKSKVAAGLLGIFLGGIGIHKFYLGRIGAGVASILFCWTGIPELVGFIEGIVYLCSSDENFSLKYHVRVQ